MIIVGVLYSLKNNKRFGRGRMWNNQKLTKAYSDFVLQARALWYGRRTIEVPVKLTADIFYPNLRFDLDDGLLMDVLQKAGILKNDRLIREKDLSALLDPKNPRVEFWIDTL